MEVVNNQVNNVDRTNHHTSENLQQPNTSYYNNYYYYVQQPPTRTNYNNPFESKNPAANNIYAFQPVFVALPNSVMVRPSSSNINNDTLHNADLSTPLEGDHFVNNPNCTSSRPQKFSNEVYIDEYSQPHYTQQNPSDHELISSYSQFSDPRLWIKPSNNSIFIDPLIVTFFNFVLLGLGHVLIGQDRKGVGYMLVTMIISFLCLIGFGFFTLPFFWFWGIMVMKDGYKLTKRLKEGIPIHQAECSNKWATKGISQFVGADLTLFNTSNPRDCSQEWLDMINQLTTI